MTKLATKKEPKRVTMSRHGLNIQVVEDKVDYWEGKHFGQVKSTPTRKRVSKED